MNLVLSCLFFSGLSYDTSIVKIGARSAKLKIFTPFVLISVDLALLSTPFFAFLATVRRGMGSPATDAQRWLGRVTEAHCRVISNRLETI